MQKLKILVVEDEPAIVRMLEPTLAASGASTDVSWSGSQAAEHLDRSDYDLILCDLGLPDIDGQQLIKQIRERTDVPIIVLSARGSEEEKIKALDSGADDYVSKPFAAGELLARIRAALRRRPAPRTSNIKLGEIEVDLARRRVLIEGEEIALTKREHALLVLLAQRAGGVATHREIIDHVWGSDAKAETQSVRVLVSQLRQKVEEDPANPRLVCTESGTGYRLAQR
jgi:two-component system KDP operon response regulator KdpE